VEKLNSYLEDAINMRIGFDKDEDADIDLTFLTSKLKKATIFIERLSDISLQLTKIGMEVNRRDREFVARLTRREKEIRASSEYAGQPNAEKGLWMANQLQPLKDETAEWRDLKEMVSEIKEAVNERAGTLKRLDSDIRLHARLYEELVKAGGAASPTSFTGNSTQEVDLT